jgi:hypothetical protein
MRTAIKIVSRAASLIQPIALRLRPLRARWDKYWDVDHRSVNFYSNDEAAAALEKQREKWNEAEKQRILQYSRVHIIPRLRFDILADKPNIGIEKRKRQYMRGNLLQNNPVAFHLLHGGVAALYLACVIGVLLWYHSVMPEPTFDAKSSNKASPFSQIHADRRPIALLRDSDLRTTNRPRASPTTLCTTCS